MKYVSEIKGLEDQKFDSVEELEKAEKEFAEKQAAKEKETLIRKEDAVKVENAFKARNAARREYNDNLVKLRDQYNEAIAVARDNFNAGLDKVGKELQAKEDEYQTALDEFYKTHGNYHLTLKDGDNQVTIVRSGSEFEEYMKPYKEFQEAWKNILENFYRF